MDKDLVINQVLSLVNKGKIKKAQNSIKNALENDPSNHEFWSLLYSLSQSREEKVICLKKILKNNPENTLAKSQLALINSKGQQTIIKKWFYLLIAFGIITIILIAFLLINPNLFQLQANNQTLTPTPTFLESTPSLAYTKPSSTNTIQPKESATPTPKLSKWINQEYQSNHHKMLYLPADTFIVGRAENEDNPLHQVTLSNGLWFSIYEVTNYQFASFLNTVKVDPYLENWIIDIPHNQIELFNGIWRSNKLYSDYPVVGITWYGAQEYCSWIGGRLPTEAEWEYAASGIDSGTWEKTKIDCDVLNAFGCLGMPTIIGDYIKDESIFGIRDLTGNVSEWVYDWYQPLTKANLSDPTGPKDGTMKVVRGGNWNSSVPELDITIRRSKGAKSADSFTGFRCILTPVND